MILKRHVALFVATGVFVGYIPVASGTFGTLVGIPLVLAFSKLPLAVAASATMAIFILAVWAAGETERQLKLKDPGCIVIDEITGFCITMLAIPFSTITCIVGFVLFRFFDVLKPPPARQMERHLKGGWGVVMDDVVAGIMAHLVLRLGLFLTTH
jgi:phosphatidylglycerophosphatase A